MAIIQVLIDDAGNVLDVKRVPVNPLIRGVTAVTSAYSFGVSSGQFRLAEDRRLNALIEQSAKLTDQEKVKFRVLVGLREIGDTIAIVAQEPILPTPLGDVPGRARVLIQVFFDP